MKENGYSVFNTGDPYLDMLLASTFAMAIEKSPESVEAFRLDMDSYMKTHQLVQEEPDKTQSETM